MSIILDKTLEVITEKAIQRSLPVALRPRFWGCLLRERGAMMRVSISCLLRLEHQGRWMLIRNFLRPETFAPIGGVMKTTASSRAILDACEFEPQEKGNHLGMLNDMRGFMPRKNVFRFVRWLDKESDRESGHACVHRELLEELSEIKYEHILAVGFDLSLRLVRIVEEGPEAVPGQPYTQYRRFYVFEPQPESSDVSGVLDRLRHDAATHKDMLLVDRGEIERGRSHGGSLIGHHAAYLLGHRRVRFGDPPFVTKKA